MEHSADLTFEPPNVFGAPVAAPAPSPCGSAERVGEAYDHLAAGYDDFHVDAKSRAENAFVARRLARRIGPTTRVLDVGCGTGLLLDLLPVAPSNYVGVDVSLGMLERARQKHHQHTFTHGDAQNLDRGLGAFDLVVSLFGSPSYCGLAPFARSVQQLRAPEGGLFLMYCGPRYVKRSTYINKSSQLLQSHDRRSLEDAYPDSRVWGMSWSVDGMPARFPASLMRGLLAFDTLTAGRWHPDLCFFLVVER